MRKIVFTLLLFFSSIEVLAQDKPEVRKAVYFEILGPGGLYSINYEQRVKDHSILRAGFSYLNIKDGFISVEGYTIPISKSWLKPMDEDSFIEIGFFATFSDFDNTKDLWIGPSLGFREQKLNKKAGVVKLFFSPLYSIRANVIAPSGGLSFGYSF